MPSDHGRGLPMSPIQTPILNRFADVRNADLPCPGQIRNRPRQLEHSVIGPGGETEPGDRCPEEALDRFRKPAILANVRARPCAHSRRGRVAPGTEPAAAAEPLRPGRGQQHSALLIVLPPAPRTAQRAPPSEYRSGRATAPRPVQGSARPRSDRSGSCGWDRPSSRRDRDSSPPRA